MSLPTYVTFVPFTHFKNLCLGEEMKLKRFCFQFLDLNIPFVSLEDVSFRQYVLLKMFSAGNVTGHTLAPGMKDAHRCHLIKPGVVSHSITFISPGYLLENLTFFIFMLAFSKNQELEVLNR